MQLYYSLFYATLLLTISPRVTAILLTFAFSVSHIFTFYDEELLSAIC
jgi:hypothetical protein